MQNYLIGTDMLVDCVERGRRFARGELVGEANRTFVVDKKTRGTDEKGAGTYVLHGAGDASAFVPGGQLYTPDGIIWDIADIDADKRGLVVNKKRDDVSFTAWLAGDWSRLTGDVPVKEPSWAHEVAMGARKTAHDVEEGAKSFTKYLPWIIGGTFAVGFLVVAAPMLTPLLAGRFRK